MSIDDGDELGDPAAGVERVGGELSGPPGRGSAAWRSQANRAIGGMKISAGDTGLDPHLGFHQPQKCRTLFSA